MVFKVIAHTGTLGLLNALSSGDRGLKVRFSLAMIVFETFELILCQMLSSQGKNAPSNPYPHYLVRLAASRNDQANWRKKISLSGPSCLTSHKTLPSKDGEWLTLTVRICWSTRVLDIHVQSDGTPQESSTVLALPS